MTVTRSIDAPADIVFQTVADPKRFAQAIAGVTSVELLPGPTTGVGTRFRQSRRMKDKESTMASIYLGLGKGELVAAYAGASSESLLEILTAWKAALIERAQALPEADRAAALALVEPYAFSVASEAQDVVTLKMDNATTGESIAVVVKMNDSLGK